MNYVLDELNAHPPENPRDLLARTAELMANETESPWDPKNESYGFTVKNEAVFLQSLPGDLRNSVSSGKVEFHQCFGPAWAMGFGNLCFPTPKRNKRHASIVSTAILFKNAGKYTQYRGYWDVLKKNYDLDERASPSEFERAFDYSIPGTGERLPLMQIATPKRLEKDYLARFSDLSLFHNELQDIQSLPFYGNIELLFLHPPYNQEYHEKFLACLQPLWDTLVTPPHDAPGPAQPPPAEKINALIDTYWLLAQATPPARGGSAFARVILEHLSHRLREQGYEIEIPLTKNSTDLWAEAATLPLNDREAGLQTGFRTRFKHGVFFDAPTKARHMMSGFRSRVTPQTAAVPSI